MWSCSSGQRIPCFESCQLPITWMSIMTSGFPMESKGIRLDSSRQYWTTLVYYQVKCMLQSLKKCDILHWFACSTDGQNFLGCIDNLEPITQSEQLPHQAYVMVFLRTSLFLDTFQGTFFHRKQNLQHVYELIRSIICQKGKLNVIKGQKILFLGLQILLTGLWNLKDIENLRQNRSKNKLVRQKCCDTSAWKLLALGYGASLHVRESCAIFA